MIYRFLCWLFGSCCHDWNKWEEIYVTLTYPAPSGEQETKGHVTAQKRCCKKCGYIQREQLTKLTPNY